MKATNPAGSTQTWCYDSDVQICSLSVATTEPTSCSQYYKALLQSKATTRCPTSMPNYFQNLKYANNVDNSIRGCTAGARSGDGKSPASTADSQCTIYTTQKEELEKLDSCTNVIRLQNAQCFSSSVGAITSLKANTYGSPFVECSVSQIEQIKKTVDENAEAEAAQQLKIRADSDANFKWVSARQGLAAASAQGPVRVLPPLTGPVELVFISTKRADEPINISQLVIRDINGTNIAPRGVIAVSSEDYGTRKETAIDGHEVPRAHPNIFHSKNTGQEWLRISFSPPVDISSISIYNRSDCCNNRIVQYQINIGQKNNEWVNIIPLTADLVQTYSFIPPLATHNEPIIQAKYVDIFSPELVTYTCNELESYQSWIDSIRVLYPDMYAKSKGNLDNSESWSDDKKNTFCNILEQTKIRKTMTESQLKAAKVIPAPQ